MKNLNKLLMAAVLAACTALFANQAQAAYAFDMVDPGYVAATAVGSLPTTCRLLAADVTHNQPIYIDCNSVNGLSATPIAGSFTTILASGTITGGSASNIAINTNKFTVTASNGNTLVAGTLSVTGHDTLEGVTSTGATGTGLLVFGTSPTLTTPTIGAATATTINGLALTASTGTLTIPNGVVLTGPAATDTVAGLGAANAFTGANTNASSVTYLAGSSLVAKTSTTTTDINPPFDNRILGNPVVKYVYGNCTVAAVNAGTCIPLALVSGRTISVMAYDIVAAGSAATCTGILLEDTNGSPVVISTIAAAALTSGTHNFVGLANNVLGVGFGAGTGLTASQGVQIKVNGSSCTTTTAFQYAITYTVQ